MEIIERELTEAEIQTLEVGLKLNKEAKGIQNEQNQKLGFSIYENNVLIAGINGHIYFNWLYISDLWVNEIHRGQGLGTKLLQAIEQKALENNITKMQLWTASYEAPEFYKRHGYIIGTELKDKPVGHSEYLMIKQAS